MAIQKYKAYHFHEFIEIVESIGRHRRSEQCIPPVLWSRGHRETDWNLKPTLMRSVELNSFSGIEHTSGRALEEELRKEHYVAKNYHFMSKDPRTAVEWMEVMQHHGVKTRLLDWSESMIHPVIFSLECFFDNKNYRTEDRINCSPCIWILEPMEWNMVVLRNLLGNHKVIDFCIESLPTTNNQKKRDIRRRLMQLRNELDQYMNVRSAKHLQAVFNLSSMMGELQGMQTRDLLYVLQHGELYYCLSYLLVHVYMDTKLWKVGEVLPLSIVEPYHSERIRAQIGAFSIFPYYEEDNLYQTAKGLNISLDAMEYMHSGNQFLHRILLCNPDEIAFEVMNSGCNVTWLYPEMPIVANTIEQRKIYL